MTAAATPEMSDPIMNEVAGVQPLGARRCAFCGKGLACFAFVRTVLEALGGEKGNGYAHTPCLARAQKKARAALSKAQPRTQDDALLSERDQ